MAQVFGNRILGGIGAPGGGMSEAFGAGVNTALGQRSTRQGMEATAQDMRMRDIDLQWKTEDREEAKRQRAAAAAAAAAARARARSLVEAEMRIYGGTGTVGGAGLNLPAAPGPGRDRQGPAVSPPAAAPTAGVRVTPSAPLSFGGAVAGGGGQTVVGGASGRDVLGAPTQTRFRTAAPPTQTRLPPTGAPAVYATPSGVIGVPGVVGVPAGRPGDFAAQATADKLAAMQAGRAGLDYEAAPQLQARVLQSQLQDAQDELVDAEAEFGANPTGETAARASAARAEVNRLTPVVQDFLAATAQYPKQRNIIALEGPESVGRAITDRIPEAPVPGPAPTVTIQGPNGPVTVSATSEDLGLSMGTTEPQQFRFGPDLGATERSQEQIMADEFVARTGVDINAPGPPKMGEPGLPKKVIENLLSEREKHVQYTQALIDAGAYEEARAMRATIAATDLKLEAAVARQAIEEARDYYAPQRLNAIWSDAENRNYEFVPTAEGIYDVYVDGRLQFPGMSMDQISEQTLMMTDQVYAQRQAELAATFADAQAEYGGRAAGEAPYEQQQALLAADIAVTQAGLMTEVEVDRDMKIKLNDISKQRIEAALRAQGILPQEARTFEYVETDMGGVQVFDGPDLIVEYVPQENQREDGSVFVTLAPVNQ